MNAATSPELGGTDGVGTPAQHTPSGNPERGAYLRLDRDLTAIAAEAVAKLGDHDAAELGEMLRRLTSHRPVLSAFARLAAALEARQVNR